MTEYANGGRAGMIKVVSCLRRLPNLSAEEFQQHWQEYHASLLLRVKHLRECVQYATVGNNPMARKKIGSDTPFDGFLVCYWDSLGALRSAMATPEYAAVANDFQYFLDHTRSYTCLVDEKVIVDLDHPSSYALVECHSHRPGQTRADFHRSWLEVHGDFGRKIYQTGLMPGYIQNRVVTMSAEEAKPFGFDQETFDGVGFAFYDSAVQLIACASLPIVTKDAFKAEDSFTDQARLGSVLTRRVILRSAAR